MKNTKEELRVVRLINAMMIEKIHSLKQELELEKELHFDTIDRHSQLIHSMEYLTNDKKPF